jgi:MSHA biogenesis protein MshM
VYEAHFGLHSAPFGLTPDVDFTYHSRAHQAAFNTLRVALDSGAGFVEVTGEVGTGKTLLSRCLLQWLAECGDRFVTAYLPNPRLTPRQLAHALAAELRVALSARADERSALARIEQALLAHAEAGRNVVLALDEAQACPEATLETLRLLSNLETGKHRLLQVVLFGQPELDELLAARALRSLASRIVHSARLEPLQFADFQHYLRHRVAVAGWRGGDLWTAPARWLLWRASGGVPRAANLLAHKSLLLAYGAGTRRVGWRQVLGAVRDGAPAQRRRLPWWPRPALR